MEKLTKGEKAIIVAFVEAAAELNIRHKLLPDGSLVIGRTGDK